MTYSSRPDPIASIYNAYDSATHALCDITHGSPALNTRYSSSLQLSTFACNIFIPVMLASTWEVYNTNMTQ